MHCKCEQAVGQYGTSIEKKNGSSKVAGSGAALLMKSTLKGIVTKLKLELNGVFSMVCTSQCWNFELYRL